jgi:hypothetical protein
MDFDTGMFAKERHARLLREVQESRIAASLQRRSQISLMALPQRMLARLRAAMAGTGAPRPARSAWQTGEE